MACTRAMTACRLATGITIWVTVFALIGGSEYLLIWGVQTARGIPLQRASQAEVSQFLNRGRLVARAECETQCVCSRGGLTGYGRSCGYRYSSCPGYPPCDAVDACCAAHDDCVGRLGYDSCECTQTLAACLACSRYGNSSGWTCEHAQFAAAMMVADVRFALPQCFDAQEMALLATAVDLSCKI